MGFCRMAQRMARKIIVCKLMMGAALVCAVLLPVHVLAKPSSASFYVSTSVSSVMVGETLTVNIYESGQDITAVQANLFYDPTKLDCIAVGGGAYSVDIASYCNNGTATLGRTVGSEQSELNGTQLVGSLTFNVIGSTRKTTIGFSTANVESGGVVMPASTASSSYELTNPPIVSTPVAFPDSSIRKGSYYNSENIGVMITYGPKRETNIQPKVTKASTEQPGKANPIISAVLSDKTTSGAVVSSSIYPNKDHQSYAIKNGISLLCIIIAGGGIVYIASNRRASPNKKIV